MPGGFATWENGREVTVEADKQLANLDFTLPPFKQGRWKTYTHENGLAGDDVSCVLQARDGALWFGTDQGVSRFDGRSFSSLPPEDGLPRSSVNRIEEDNAGRMWMIGEATKLFRYDPKAPSPRVRAFTTADGLPADNVTALAADKSGRLWVGTAKGLCYHDAEAEKSGGKPFVSTTREESELIKDLTPGGRHGALAGAARRVGIWRSAAFLKSQPMTAEKVLQLDGNDSYVELPSNIFNDLTEATVEGWVKWKSHRKYSRFFDFGNTWKSMVVSNQAGTDTLYFSLSRPPFTTDSELKMTVPGLTLDERLVPHRRSSRGRREPDFISMASRWYPIHTREVSRPSRMAITIIWAGRIGKGRQERKTRTSTARWMRCESGRSRAARKRSLSTWGRS